MPRSYRLLWLLLIAVGIQAPLAAARDVLRVCADPNNLPFSHKDETGIENRIAKVWAEKLGVPLEYTWFPQRLGFVRNTLNAPAADRTGYKCDVVMGVAAGAGQLLTTEPYYYSTYALVYGRGGKLSDVKSGQQFAELPAERKQQIKVATFAPTPGYDWLARHGMTNQTVSHPVMSGDPAAYPGQIIEQDLLGKQVDAVVVWGPIAGYYAKQSRDAALEVIPLASEPPDIQFEFGIAAGVRMSDKEGKAELQSLIEQTRGDIDALLKEFGFPLVPAPAKPADAQQSD
jgi:quinoprotein dehydrogenase-associated probable ABC transporter substrate-binding protein